MSGMEIIPSPIVFNPFCPSLYICIFVNLKYLMKMKKLFFSFMVLGGMLSCTAPKSDAPAPEASESESADSLATTAVSLDGEWTVVSIFGNDVTSETKPAFVFTGDTVNGATGCNRFFGPFKSTADSLLFSDMATTKMMCPDIAVEDSFLKAVHQVVTYSIADSTLSMKNADNQVVIVCKK